MGASPQSRLLVTELAEAPAGKCTEMGGCEGKPLGGDFDHKGEGESHFSRNALPAKRRKIAQERAPVEVASPNQVMTHHGLIKVYQGSGVFSSNAGTGIRRKKKLAR